MTGLDEARHSGIVAEGVADFPNAPLQHRVTHRDVGPHGVEQLFLRHELTGVFEEVFQDAECLGPERNHAVIRTVQALVGHVEPEGTEADLPLRRHDNFTKPVPELHRFFTTRRAQVPILATGLGKRK